jgi:DNA-binding PadR family transcriptional regulator
MLRDFFRGFIKIHILYHASQAPVYGLEMAEELRRHGYNVSPGTLYPTLHTLERQGLLSSERQLEDGRWRTYYTATPAGLETLAAVQAKLRELVGEVLQGA